MKRSGVLVISLRADSWILVSLRVLTMKCHLFSFKLSFRVPKGNALISVFWLDFCCSLKTSLLAWAPFLNSGW